MLFSDFVEFSFCIFLTTNWPSIKQLFIIRWEIMNLYFFVVGYWKIIVFLKWYRVYLIFMFLESLHHCLHIWRSRHLLQSLLTSFSRKNTFLALLGILRLFQIFSMDTSSHFLFPLEGDFLLFWALQSQANC